ncbi:MAG: F0F1 ATP synthase subunit gamma [Planctomycetaceae bacterium]|nr:F0F1 ATP synthase subunit gamma [Planctomycetaceae bacterium]
MHAAERNIQSRLDELRSEYHQKRQTVITEELLDVVTGVEALMRGSTRMMKSHNAPVPRIGSINFF